MWSRLSLSILIGVMIAGCVTDADRRHRSGADQRPAYIVHSGDTLDSIAWKFNLDVNDVACWNRMFRSREIRAGQLIFLGPPREKDRFAWLYCRSSRSNRNSARQRPTAPVASRPAPARAQPPARIQPPVRTQPVVVAKPRDVEPLPGTMAVDWQWPLVDRDGQPPYVEQAVGKAGVMIKGRPGQAVFAAADGKVVYSGNNLKGYGELVIIKHNDELISAYGHNRRLFAPEGLWVKKGRKIAELGVQPDGRAMLYFDIRRFGKSVDPLRYLPGR